MKYLLIIATIAVIAVLSVLAMGVYSTFHRTNIVVNNDNAPEWLRPVIDCQNQVNYGALQESLEDFLVKYKQVTFSKSLALEQDSSFTEVLDKAKVMAGTEIVFR